MSEILDAFWNLFVNRSDTYAVQLEKGYSRVDAPLTKEVLIKHFAGELTVGTYQINPEDNSVKWLCFDLDPEHIQDPKTVAAALYNAAIGSFFPKSVWLEASRFPDPSYHVWSFFLSPIPAKAARWLGLKILERAGVKCELFPKQDSIGAEGFGNLVKLPYGIHRVVKKLSWFLDPATFRPLSVECLHNVIGSSFSEREIARILELTEREPGITVSKIDTSRGEQVSNFDTLTPAYKRRCFKIRPCFREALKDPMLPHGMRLALAVEYLASGYTVEKVTTLFQTQEDFNEGKTRYQVEHAREKGYRPRKCSTIQGLGYCIGEACPIFRGRQRLFAKTGVF